MADGVLFTFVELIGNLSYTAMSAKTVLRVQSETSCCLPVSCVRPRSKEPRPPGEGDYRPCTLLDFAPLGIRPLTFSGYQHQQASATLSALSHTTMFAASLRSRCTAGHLVCEKVKSSRSSGLWTISS